jgi:hypothetical protein
MAAIQQARCRLMILLAVMIECKIKVKKALPNDLPLILEQLFVDIG